jgi:hypothetical protein
MPSRWPALLNFEEVKAVAMVSPGKGASSRFAKTPPIVPASSFGSVRARKRPFVCDRRAGNTPAEYRRQHHYSRGHDMLHTARSVPPSLPARSPDRPAPGEPMQTVAGDATVAAAHPAPPVTVFEDLPAELIVNVAADVFQAAVHDPEFRVESLCCNDTLRTGLAEERRAGEVLRRIQASRDLPGLCAALRGVPGVFPPYRHGCLRAALHLLPRLNQASTLPEPVWSQLGELLSSVVPAAGAGATDTSPCEDLLQQLVQGLRHNCGHSVSCLEHVMVMVGNGPPPGPRLANTLLQWASELVDRPFYSGLDEATVLQRLLAVAPQALQPRLQKLCDFSRLRKQRTDLPPDQAMVAQIDSLAKVCADDLPHHLRMVGRFWRCLSKKFPGCAEPNLAVFLRMSPRQQVDFVLRNLSPFDSHEVASFLQTKIGQVPGAELLKVARQHEDISSSELSPDQEQLIRLVVQDAAGTPQLAEVLHEAISHKAVRDPGLVALITRHLACVDENDQRALSLRLGLKTAGTAHFGTSHGEARAELSRRIDLVLDADSPPSFPEIETLVRMEVGWFTLAQRLRLIDHVMALPPATCARLLLVTIPRRPHPYFPSHALPLTGRTVAACASLPPEFQAAPLTSLLNLVRVQDETQYRELRRAVSRIYHALPIRLRPPFNPAWRDMLAQPMPPPATPSRRFLLAA